MTDTPEGYKVDAVEAWIKANIPSLSPPFTWTRLEGGHSNLTYKIEDSNGAEAVIRRPPQGQLLPKAHDMSREWALISSLGPGPTGRGRGRRPSRAGLERVGGSLRTPGRGCEIAVLQMKHGEVELRRSVIGGGRSNHVRPPSSPASMLVGSSRSPNSPGVRAAHTLAVLSPRSLLVLRERLA